MVEHFLLPGRSFHPSLGRCRWAAQGDSGDLLSPRLPLAQSQICGHLENRSTEQIQRAYSIYLCPHLCPCFPFVVTPFLISVLSAWAIGRACGCGCRTSPRTRVAWGWECLCLRQPFP